MVTSKGGSTTKYITLPLNVYLMHLHVGYTLVCLTPWWSYSAIPYNGELPH